MSEDEDFLNEMARPLADGKPFLLVWLNPVTRRRTTIGFDTREEAQARVEHYARKYGDFKHYRPARIIETS